MAGEKSGNMEEVLNRYISFQRLAMTFKKKLIVSLVYPTLLVVVVTMHGGFPGHLRSAEFAKLFERPGCEAANDSPVHANLRTQARNFMPFLAMG